MTREEKELIAKFDGWKKSNHLHPFDIHKGYLFRKKGCFGDYWLDKMPYDNDWNWIMNVWKKIQKMYYKGYPIVASIGSGGGVIYINKSSVGGEKFEGEREIANTLNINYFANVPEEEVSLEESITKAIIIYIDWFNKNKKEIA